MDKYLKSRIKLWILQAFNWIPDKQMIQLQYRIKTKRKLNLKNPTRYNEKLQWYKLYYRKPMMARCADKWEVRKFVTEKGYEDILNESYGVFDDADAIPFDKLPDQFVIKATNGASGIGIKLCLIKDSLAIQDLKREIDGWLKPQKNGGGREWVYYRTKPRILIEKYLHPGIGEESLMTYKIFCFQGKPCYLYVINEKFTERDVGFSILDTDYRPTPYFLRGDKKSTAVLPERPEKFDRMLEIAANLSEDFPHVRVDFYNIDGKIYFSELTFFSCSGYSGFEPDEFDFILGEKFILPCKSNEE